MTDINAQLIGVKEQINLSRLSASDEKLRMSLLGQMYMADWKHLLVASGRMFRLSGGTVTGGDGLTLLTGTAVVNLDQPQGYVAVDSGLMLIPVELEVAAQSDDDAYEDEVTVLLSVDRTTAIGSSLTALEGEASLASGTSIQNVLDGGPAFGGRAGVSITADVPDPVHADILAAKVWEVKQLAAETAGTPSNPIYYHKEWGYPSPFRGPCSLLLYIGGTVAPAWMGSLVFGAVPTSWFPVE